jgi:hypothetical protein
MDNVASEAADAAQRVKIEQSRVVTKAFRVYGDCTCSQ